MVIETPKDSKFNHIYSKHFKLLKLKGLQQTTIDVYSRAIRRIGHHFDYELEHLSFDQLTDYFTHLYLTYHLYKTMFDYFGMEHPLQKQLT